MIAGFFDVVFNYCRVPSSEHRSGPYCEIYVSHGGTVWGVKGEHLLMTPRQDRFTKASHFHNTRIVIAERIKEGWQLRLDGSNKGHVFDDWSVVPHVRAKASPQEKRQSIYLGDSNESS